KHLRGESMADVIFNGSTARKPVGQAFVELVFDNSAGRLGGKFAQYNEISVKRLVTRDGTSNYYLNGSRCRRRDITDIFLGTGLGPRSYAIIEQGMISRLIEAKPEELRNLLEEAAGISIYKERRRETETRIRHTRDNLNRITDVLDELEKNLEKLKRQARTAERYKELRKEEREKTGYLMALQWKELDTQVKLADEKISAYQNQLEAEIANLRSQEAAIENQRVAYTEGNDELNEIQGDYYRIGSNIAQREQSIQHAKERKNQLEMDLRKLEKNLESTIDLQKNDKMRSVDLENRLGVLQPEFEELNRQAQEQKASFDEATEAMNTWRHAWDELNEKANEPARLIDVEQTKLNHLEDKLEQQQQRRSKLEEELERLDISELEKEIEVISNNIQALENEREELQFESQEKDALLKEQRVSLQEQQEKSAEARTQLEQLEGRISSLEALQEAALGKNQVNLNAWLQQNGLESAQRLAQQINVADGWEKAVETALGFNLEAVCVDDLSELGSSLAAISDADIGVIQASSRNASPIASGNKEPLLSKVSSQYSLHSMLNGVYCAEDVSQAMANRQHLSDGESYVTRDGIWVSADWIRVLRGHPEKSGVLSREKELKTSVEKRESLMSQLSELESRIRETKDKIASTEEARHSLSDSIHGLQSEIGELKARQAADRSKIEQTKQRIDRIEEDLAELDEQREQTLIDTAESQRLIEQAEVEKAELEAVRTELLHKKEKLQNGLDESRKTYEEYREQSRSLELELQTTRTQNDSLKQNLQRFDSQIDQFQDQIGAMHEQMEQVDAPLGHLKEELASLLDKHREVDIKLSETRRKVEAIDEELNSLNDRRQDAEGSVNSARERLEQEKIDSQSFKTRRQSLQEQMEQAGHNLTTLFEVMDDELTISLLQEELEKLASKIQKLGAINLAAIDEFAEESERFTHLNSQKADLEQALDTLENAIRKIDKETKTKFEETFEQVNNGIKRNFPKLFGGGQAFLELTGEDLLTTGVSIMARPPGKRISNIHLLSGGEKALTAVALIFSIFELNPAPFCMLDEVDAPLDDANVGRFCTLVEHMSENVQFIMITHNKVTMEIAKHLNGVTMHEPGVSRMVAVDVDEAVELAAV
ncbi:MAG: chromosome segregation protein SMC, partial [Gammaproteobacteria bacterium]|nr:chromosome segregation protein SMC [Gammaproteobacteria bacterium]